ncbi:hypothetical protein TNIN_256691 [Trichonephila inaurata madagascariensis]|uniref:Uncharacterized protein n=1 Tax=Trichonephila inaurata madagascariensis TaxID=2747483 RepID=A0A8X6YBI4_9ARAC|nr:hypothetical protein TNIN_256691 [Trichonephila inaurata madagascariensis]
MMSLLLNAVTTCIPHQAARSNEARHIPEMVGLRTCEEDILNFNLLEYSGYGNLVVKMASVSLQVQLHGRTTV